MSVEISMTVITKIINSMGYIMLSIYSLVFMSRFGSLKELTIAITFITIMDILELIKMCLLCDSMDQKVYKISIVLNDMNANEMSDMEFREWQMFVQLLQNRPTFGFTIAGFAKFNKSTLISVLYCLI